MKKYTQKLCIAIEVQAHLQSDLWLAGDRSSGVPICDMREFISLSCQADKEKSLFESIRSSGSPSPREERRGSGRIIILVRLGCLSHACEG